MSTTTLIRRNANPENVALGKRKLGVWVLFGALYCGTTFKNVYGALLPDIQTLAPITGSPINERDHYEMGFIPTKVDDGTDYSLTMEVEGNSRDMPAWLIGQYMTTSPIIAFGRNYGVKGALIVYNVDENDVLTVCDVLLNVGVKLMQLPGGNDGENNLSIDLYANDSESISVAEGHKVSFEFFVDTVTDPNSAAPDAANLTFTLGDGNRSYATPAPPTTILALDTARPGVTGLYKYFLWLKLDGVDVQDSEASFNATTKVLTFTAAPAAGAMLEMGYVVDKAGVGVLGEPAHHWTGSSFLTTPDAFM